MHEQLWLIIDFIQDVVFYGLLTLAIGILIWDIEDE